MKKELSRGDEVYSRDVFEVLVEYEITRSIRYPTPVGFLQIEMTPTGLDEKSIQAAPKTFTKALNSHLRSVDIPSGAGREYRVLLPTTNDAGVRAVCARLLSVFRNKFTTQDGSSIAFSLCIGAISHMGGETLSIELLFEQAKNALKQSKLKGPNTYTILS